jgi:hypothetical protein
MLSLVYYAYYFCETQRQATQMQENLLIQARAQRKQQESDKNLRDTFLPRYQALIDSGFIGDERRQTWIDALAEIQKKHRLFEIQYEIGRLTPANAAFLPQAAPLTLYQSEMKLRFALLHEGDLLTLTQALMEKKLSPYIIKRCEVGKFDDEKNVMDDRRPTPALTATCDISWFTLVEPNTLQTSPAL